jgi:hypothetical protein
MRKPPEPQAGSRIISPGCEDFDYHPHDVARSKKLAFASTKLNENFECVTDGIPVCFRDAIVLKFTNYVSDGGRVEGNGIFGGEYV